MAVHGYQKRPRVKRTRQVITWKNPLSEENAAIKLPPHREAIYKEPQVPDEKLLSSFVIGKAVIATCGIDIDVENKGAFEYAPLKHAGLAGHVRPAILLGSLFIYAGHVRGDERKWMNSRWTKIRVIKHTFITPRGRFIIDDFTLIAPLQE